MFGQRKRNSDIVRQDLLVDVAYGDRTKEEVYVWMMLLTLEYLKIIKSCGKVDLHYEMVYSNIYNKSSHS